MDTYGFDWQHKVDDGEASDSVDDESDLTWSNLVGADLAQRNWYDFF